MGLAMIAEMMVVSTSTIIATDFAISEQVC
jgi:hypothetical protein